MIVNKKAQPLPPQPTEVAKLYSQQSGEEATLFLYGSIGDRWSVESSDDAITALNVVKALDKMVAAGAKTINIRINSNGGYTSEGLAIITAIKECAAEIHTWNDGCAYSMAADIWFCAKQANRHMAKGATLLIHAPSSSWGCYGTAKDLREAAATASTEMEKVAQMLDAIAEGTMQIMADATGASMDDIKKEFYDYADHTLSYADCEKRGFVTGDAYEAEGTMKPKKSVVDTIVRKFFPKSYTAIQEPINDTEMVNQEAIAAALKAGDIQLADLKNLVLEAEKLAPLSTESVEQRFADIEKKFDDRLAEKDAVINALKAQVENLGARPAGTPPLIPSGVDGEAVNDPAATKDAAEMEAYNTQVLEAQKSGKGFRYD